MSTNSTIGIKLKNGKVMAVYCHWDGHIETAGATLQKHYNIAKTKKLMALGDLSILGQEIGVKQDFDSFDARTNNTCLFYGRDRGDQDVDAKTFNSVKEMVKWYDNTYNYLLDEKTGAWLASSNGGKKWFELKKALNR